MNAEQIDAARELVGRLHVALQAERLSATIRIVDGDDGEPKLRIASSETGEARQRLNRVVLGVLNDAGVQYHHLRN